MFKDKLKRYMAVTVAVTLGIVIAICAFFIIYKFDKVVQMFDMILGIFRPFIYGAVIAYILRPLCRQIERFTKKLLTSKTKLKEGAVDKISCWTGIILSIISAVLIIYVLIVLIVPQLIDTIYSLIDIFPQYYKSSIAYVRDFLSKYAYSADIIGDTYKKIYDAVYKWMNSDLVPNMQVAISSLSTGVVNAVSLVMNLGIGIIVSIYLLYNRKKFLRQIKLVIYSVFNEKWADKIVDEMKYTDKMFGGFINGKIIDSFIIGILCYIILCILRIPYPMLISVIVGVTNIVPFFGPFIGAVPCVMLIFILDPIKALYFMIVVVVLQFLDGYVIGPKILGDAIGLDSFWILFSVLVFGGFFGFIGMVIGVPTFAVVYDIIRQLVGYGLKKYDKQGMLDEYKNDFAVPAKPKKKVKPAEKK